MSDIAHSQSPPFLFSLAAVLPPCLRAIAFVIISLIRFSPLSGRFRVGFSATASAVKAHIRQPRPRSLPDCVSERCDDQSASAHQSKKDRHGLGHVPFIVAFCTLGRKEDGRKKSHSRLFAVYRRIGWRNSAGCHVIIIIIIIICSVPPNIKLNSPTRWEFATK